MDVTDSFPRLTVRISTLSLSDNDVLSMIVSSLVKIALPYFSCGLSTTSFIPGTLGRHCCGPLCVS